MLVLITGASGGLGYELTKKFYEKGDSLILAAREDSIKKLKLDFKDQIYLDIDFLNDSISNKLNAYLQDEIPDLIIHCAGGKIENDFHPIDTDVLKDSMQLNFFSAIEINNFFIEKALNSKKNMRIIHISSDVGITGRASPSYSISKGALNTYIKNSGRVYAQDNIMICGLICGIFEHENSVWTKKKKENPKYYEEVKNKSTLKRFADVNEVAEVVIEISKSKSILYSAELINITAGNI